jgi:hypothetical protein
MDVGAFVAVAKKTAPRGALEELGQRKDQKHNYRRAEKGQLTPFKVRVVIRS